MSFDVRVGQEGDQICDAKMVPNSEMGEQHSDHEKVPERIIGARHNLQGSTSTMSDGDNVQDLQGDGKPSLVIQGGAEHNLWGVYKYIVKWGHCGRSTG